MLAYQYIVLIKYTTFIQYNLLKHSVPQNLQMQYYSFDVD
jgi:hypothetical protein